MNELTPRQIVEFLDRYIVGQTAAKKAVAVAIRNRWRRMQLDSALAADVSPKNIIMIGPTGVGKTEIARRIAQLVKAPMTKVEASKFTEVGYVGRDVESIIRDLVEAGINLVRQEKRGEVSSKAGERVEERLLDMLLHQEPAEDPAALGNSGGEITSLSGSPEAEARIRKERLRTRFREKLAKGDLDDRELELRVDERGQNPMVEIFSNSGVEQMGIDFKNLFDRIQPKKSKQRRLTVAEARQVLTNEESEKLLDNDKIVAEAIKRVETSGIVFIDEIDKIAGREDGSGQPQISREGVQRDLLPIVEGSTVNTRHGPVRTQHILFIAAGAFHISSPADLIPELQGRFPIRVELADLTKDEFVRILTEPESALIKQYQALMLADGIKLEFPPDGIEEIARLAEQVNERNQNIGARRLHTILERLLDDISFQAPDCGKQTLTLDREAVFLKLAGIIEDDDLTKYVL